MKKIKITKEALFDYMEALNLIGWDTNEAMNKIHKMVKNMVFYKKASFVDVYRFVEKKQEKSYALFKYKNKILGICEFEDYLACDVKKILRWLATTTPNELKHKKITGELVFSQVETLTTKA